MIAEDWGNVKEELGGTATSTERDGRPVISDRFSVGDLNDPDDGQKAYAWLVERVNTFVNVLWPRVRSAATDFENRLE